MSKTRKILSFVALAVFLAVGGLYYVYVLDYVGVRYVNGIRVSELLRSAADERYRINYCKLLKKATMNDADAIQRLTFLDCFGGESSYNHGAVIVGLIEYIGEDNFIGSLGELDNQQKTQLDGYIMAGMEYGGYSHLKDKTLKDAFPKVDSVLKANREYRLHLIAWKWGYTDNDTAYTIEEDFTSIGGSAFYRCGALTSITISSRVTAIGHGAFFNCSLLTSVTSLNPVPPDIEGGEAFNPDVNPIAATLHVPASGIDAYKQAPGWGRFEKIISLPPATTPEIDD